MRCRIGGASALFNQGVSPEFIKAIGRWWSGAYLLYIRQMQGMAQKLMGCKHARRHASIFRIPRMTSMKRMSGEDESVLCVAWACIPAERARAPRGAWPHSRRLPHSVLSNACDYSSQLKLPRFNFFPLLESS